jgi:hypothetical protein
MEVLRIDLKDFDNYNHNMQKIIQISDELFWGYNMIIDINNYSSFEELGLAMKKDLINFLNTHNLQLLKEKAELLNLHNHNFEKYEDIYNRNDDIIYLCGHC